jgi:hypothetical protein
MRPISATPSLTSSEALLEHHSSRHLSGIISTLFEAGLYFLDPPQPRYLPKSGRPHRACQLGLRVSEKYSSDYFSLKSSVLFFSATFYYVPWRRQKEMVNKTKKKSAPFFPL